MLLDERGQARSIEKGMRTFRCTVLLEPLGCFRYLLLLTSKTESLKVRHPSAFSRSIFAGTNTHGTANLHPSKHPLGDRPRFWEPRRDGEGRQGSAADAVQGDDIDDRMAKSMCHMMAPEKPAFFSETRSVDFLVLI